jgi:hypothetical protein
MNKIINFDLDGTIANLYGVEGWLNDLINSNPRPYIEAKPLVNMQVLARLLNKLRKRGYTINVISWLSKNSNAEYDRMVTDAKIKWLKTHLASVEFDNIYIVAYGTPKQTLANGILFDDEIGNRIAWNGIAYDVDNIIGILKTFN